MKCWGYNGANEGRLGINNVSASWITTPVDVYGLSTGVADISVGFGHTCVLTDLGGVKCWGLDDFGQLGDNSSLQHRAMPVDVEGLSSGVANISAGGQHTCAVMTSGTVKCWGRYQPTPATVTNIAGVTRLSLGYSHTCALTSDGRAKCWGSNGNGQVGANSSLTYFYFPQDVVGLAEPLKDISAGAAHTCAVTVSGAAFCWGQDNMGHLGNDPLYQDSRQPVQVHGLASGVVAISAGTYHTCAITDSKGLKCWGANNYGQLGTNSTSERVPTPVDVKLQ